MTDNYQYEAFKKAVLDIAVETVPDRQIDDFDEHEHPELRKPFFCLTFFLAEEPHVDTFIKTVRDRMLDLPSLNNRVNSDRYIYQVWKSHIQSHNFWSVNFWLADKYQFTEDSQP